MQIVVMNYATSTVTTYVLSKEIVMDKNWDGVLDWLLKNTNYDERDCYYMCGDNITYDQEWIDV